MDNGSSDETRSTVKSFQDCLQVRYLFEPTRGIFGKSHALNRAIAHGGLGEPVAVLDGDISLREDRLQGVSAISGRWPDADVFTSETLTRWLRKEVPGWALRPRSQSWIFSSVDYGSVDKTLPAGRWSPGGHFWFRSRHLAGGRRFKDTWVIEPDFMLRLTEQASNRLFCSRSISCSRVFFVGVTRCAGSACFSLMSYNPSRTNNLSARWWRWSDSTLIGSLPALPAPARNTASFIGGAELFMEDRWPSNSILFGWKRVA